MALPWPAALLRRVVLGVAAFVLGTAAAQAQTNESVPPSAPAAPQFSEPGERTTRPESKLPAFESRASRPEHPEPPLGSALFSGERLNFRKLFEAHGEGVPPGDRPWPDVADPGPDFGDFPNSSYTLPQGRAYVEFMPLDLAGPDSQAPASYSAPFLLRYGLTDDVEFRIFASGITHVSGDHPTTGFSPLALDFKVHLWDDKREWLLPASSLEVYVQTTWGSPEFNGGWQPSINMNFDLPLTNKTNLEWTVGFSSVQDAVNVVSGERFIPRHRFRLPVIHRMNVNVTQLSVQWALEHDVNERLQVFFHGYHNGAILMQQGAGIVVGGGLFWKFSPRLMGFGSVNAGLTTSVPPVLGQVGFALAL